MTREDRIKHDPAFKIVTIVGDGESLYYAIGPRGMKYDGLGFDNYFRDRDALSRIVDQLNDIFYLGVEHAERKANASNVPCPQSPPKSIH